MSGWVPAIRENVVDFVASSEIGSGIVLETIDSVLEVPCSEVLSLTDVTSSVVSSPDIVDPEWA
mgnify:CR=1 FL=1